MEGLAGFESKFSYSMRMHSGRTASTELLPFDAPSMSDDDKGLLIETMRQHAVSCPSGDSTLEALAECVQDVAELDGDDRLVFVISDAMWGRYGYSPEDLRTAMSADANVTVVLFLIAEPNAAEFFQEAMPDRHVVICSDTWQLPLKFKEIFTPLIA